MDWMAEIEERLAAATPGPWWDESGVIHAKAADWTDEIHRCDHIASIGVHAGRYPANADLIAHAPDDLARLLAEVRRLEVEVARLTLERDDARAEVERLRKQLEARA